MPVDATKIICQDLQLAYPIYNIDGRSFKRCLTSIATGGTFINEDSNVVKVNALNRISFHLNEGDRLGLVGHNGAGKSTLLRVLAGVYEPENGTVYVNGKVASLLNVNVGMQPTLTGYENIYIRGLFLGLSKPEIEIITKDIEEFTELGKYLAMPVKTYSTGMLVRLAFGLSTAVASDILLLDEIIGTGDMYFINKAKTRLNNLINQAKILILASHMNDTLRQFCTQALWLEQGQIKQMGPIEEVLSAYENTNPTPSV